MKLKLYPSINLELAVNMGFEFTELVWIVELLELEQQQVFPFSDNSQYLKSFDSTFYYSLKILLLRDLFNFTLKSEGVTYVLSNKIRTNLLFRLV